MLNAATLLGTISVSHDAVLEHVRKLVNGLMESTGSGGGPQRSLSPPGLGGSQQHQQQPGRTGSPPLVNGDMVEKLGSDWCFIDCKLVVILTHQIPNVLFNFRMFS